MLSILNRSLQLFSLLTSAEKAVLGLNAPPPLIYTTVNAPPLIYTTVLYTTYDSEFLECVPRRRKQQQQQEQQEQQQLLNLQTALLAVKKSNSTGVLLLFRQQKQQSVRHDTASDPFIAAYLTLQYSSTFGSIHCKNTVLCIGWLVVQLWPLYPTYTAWDREAIPYTYIQGWCGQYHSCQYLLPLWIQGHIPVFYGTALQLGHINVPHKSYGQRS